MENIKITIPTTVRELIEKLQSFPAEAVINLRNDETGEKFYMYSLDAVNEKRENSPQDQLHVSRFNT